MALMALDHARDFFQWRRLESARCNRSRAIPHALDHTFLRPTFIFLAGLAAYLYGAWGRSLAQTSPFLFTRGLLLILIEFTVVKLGWTSSAIKLRRSMRKEALLATRTPDPIAG